LLSAANLTPLSSLKRKVGVAVAISKEIRPLNSLTK
jgi:hypothetical protein